MEFENKKFIQSKYIFAFRYCYEAIIRSLITPLSEAAVTRAGT